MNIPTYLSGVLHVKANRIIKTVVQDELVQFDLKPTQWSILGQIYLHPTGRRASDIAEALGVEASLVTMLVQPLIKRGLVTKLTHARDGRARVLTLTPEGRVLVDSVELLLKLCIQRLLDGVSREDQDTYQRVIEVIIKNGANVDVDPVDTTQ